MTFCYVTLLLLPSRDGVCLPPLTAVWPGNLLWPVECNWSDVWALGWGLKYPYKFFPFLLLALKPPCEGASWGTRAHKEKEAQLADSLNNTHASEAIWQLQPQSICQGSEQHGSPRGRPAEASPSWVQPKLLTHKTLSKQVVVALSP